MVAAAKGRQGLRRGSPSKSRSRSRGGARRGKGNRSTSSSSRGGPNKRRRRRKVSSSSSGGRSRSLPAAWRKRKSSRSVEREKKREELGLRQEEERRSRSRSASVVWRRIERLRPRSASRKRQRHLNSQDDSDYRDLERKVKAQVRSGKRRGAVKSALGIIELGQRIPEDVSLQLLELAAREPGTEVFAQILQITIIGAGLVFKIEDYAKIIGIMMQREAPEPQIRAFLNCALPKAADVLPPVPRDLTEVEIAELFDNNREVLDGEDENDELDPEDDEDDATKGGPPPSVITMSQCKGRPELNGKYSLSLQLSSKGWPAYEKDRLVKDAAVSDGKEGIVVHWRPKFDSGVESGWIISYGTAGEVLAINPKEERSPPCLGWKVVKGEEKFPETGGFMNKQVGVPKAKPQESSSTSSGVEANGSAAPEKTTPQPAQGSQLPEKTTPQPAPGSREFWKKYTQLGQEPAVLQRPSQPKIGESPESKDANGAEAALTIAKDKKAKEREYRESREALERLNLEALKGCVKAGSRGVSEYFGHFCVLMHLEFLADRRSIKRRREKAKIDKLVRWGWALQGLRLMNTFGRKEGGGRNQKYTLPGWEDHGVEMGALATQGHVDMERLRIKRGDSVTVSLSDPAIDKLAEATVNDIKPGVIVLQLRKDWPKDSQNLFFRVDKSANSTVYERQLQALCYLPQASKAQACVELLTHVPVGGADSWATAWRKKRAEGSRSMIERSPKKDKKRKEKGKEKKKEKEKEKKKEESSDKDGGSDEDSEAWAMKQKETCKKLAEEEPRGFKEEDVEKAREAAMTLPNMNVSQRTAVDAAMTRTCTVIQGPPGTGKTHVSVQILSMWAKTMGLSPLLATSDSNVAVDNICEGLRAKGVKAVRVGRPEKVRGIIEDMTLESELKKEKEKQQAEEEKKWAEEEAMAIAEDREKKSKAKGEMEATRASADGENEGERGACDAESGGEKAAALVIGSIVEILTENEEGSTHNRLREGTKGMSGKIIADDGSSKPDKLFKIQLDNGVSPWYKRPWIKAKIPQAEKDLKPKEAKEDISAFARPLIAKGGKDKAKGKGKDGKSGTKGEQAQRAFEDRRAQNRMDFELQMKILRETEVICTTTMAAGGDFLSKFVFQAVLVDEVAQATELSAVVPVILRGAKRTVYVGDHCQLPPSVISSEAEMRGLSFSVYSRLTSSGGLSPFLLDTQYRSHPKLAEFSSTAFYDGKVASGITMGDRVPPKGIEWPNPNCPVVFINVDANEEVEAESKLNSVEAQLLAHIVSNVLQCGELKVEDVGVVTPYMAQVRRLRQYLRPMLPYGCDPRLLECSSVDNFQGREKELIIFSAVRSNERGNVGFLADWRRLNVMLTRPRRGLVVVGNAKTLKHDATWEKWLKFAEDNSCVVMDMKMPQINDMFQSEPQWQDDWGYGQKGDMWKGKFGSGQKGDMLKGKGGFGQKGDKGKGWNAWDDSWRPGASAWDLAWNLRHSAGHWGDDWGFGESWNAATWAGKGNNSWQAPGSQATMQTMQRGSAWENGGQSWDSSNSWADGHWGPDDRAWGSDSSWGGGAWEKQAEDFSNEQKESFKTALDKLREHKNNAVASAGEQAEASEWQQKRDQLMQIQREQLRKMVDDHRRDGGEREPDVAMIQDPEVSSMAKEANARVGSSLPQVAAVPAATCLTPSGILQAATCASTNPAAHLTTSQSAAERFDAAAALHKVQTEQAAKLAQTQAATLAQALAQTQVAAGAQHTGTVQAGAAAVAQYAQLAQAQSAQLQNSLVANAAQAQFAQAGGVAGQAQQAHVLQQVQQLQQLQQYQQLQQIQQAQMLQYQQLLQQQGSKS